MPVLAELKAADVDQHPAQARSMSCCSSIRSAGVTHETANVRAAWDGECLCWRAFQTPAVSHCLVNYTPFLSSWLRAVQCYPHGLIPASRLMNHMRETLDMPSTA